jgi:hypothetical protein
LRAFGSFVGRRRRPTRATAAVHAPAAVLGSGTLAVIALDHASAITL